MLTIRRIIFPGSLLLAILMRSRISENHPHLFAEITFESAGVLALICTALFMFGASLKPPKRWVRLGMQTVAFVMLTVGITLLFAGHLAFGRYSFALLGMLWTVACLIYFSALAWFTHPQPKKPLAKMTAASRVPQPPVETLRPDPLLIERVHPRHHLSEKEIAERDSRTLAVALNYPTKGSLVDVLA